MTTVPSAATAHAMPSGISTEWPRIMSEDIFGSHTAVHIEHAGQLYLLRVTRENKLILTK